MDQAFGLRGQMCTRTRYEDNAILFEIQTRSEKVCCAHCHSRNVVHDGQRVRVFRTIPIGSKQVFLVKTVYRLKCKECGKVLDEDIHFAAGKRTYTNKLARLATELSGRMTIKDVAQYLHLTWDTVKEIQKRFMKRHYGNPDLSNLKYIGIDEFAVAKGHKYKTIVANLANGQVVYIGDGRDKASLDKFWKEVKKAGAKIEAVATDMSQAFTSAVREHCPDAVHVYDHFHVVKMMNDVVDDVRRYAYNKERDEGNRQILKGTRWLLLYRGNNLKGKNAEERLAAALNVNKPLMKAYYLKESLFRIWSQASKEYASIVFDDWTREAIASRVPALRKFGRNLAAKKEQVLAWYDNRISTGKLEGINNKIKTMKRLAYGYRDMKFFELKILAMHDPIHSFFG